MLAIQAAVLPMPKVHAREVVRQVLEHALMHHLWVALTGTFGMPGVELDEPVQRFAHQQRTPLVVGIALGATEDDARYTHAQLLEAVQRIEFTQYGGPPERVQQAAVDMPDLALGVQQLAIGIVETLHATLATAPLVRLLDPLALLAPVKIEPRL